MCPWLLCCSWWLSFFLSLFYFGLTFPPSRRGSSTAGQSHGKNVLTYARSVKTKTKPLPTRRNSLLKQFLGQQGFTGEKKSFRGRQTGCFFARRIPSGEVPRNRLTHYRIKLWFFQNASILYIRVHNASIFEPINSTKIDCQKSNKYAIFVDFTKTDEKRSKKFKNQST